MTIETSYYNWQAKPEDPAYNRCSPNLVALKACLALSWRLLNLGCYGERPIRAGTAPSSHSHGAAVDLKYDQPAAADSPALDLAGVGARDDILGFLIDYSAELHVQAIHDYWHSRIWHAGRTTSVADAHGAWWKAQPINPANGMGQDWARYFHIETTLGGWGDGTDAAARIAAAPEPAPTPVPTPGGFMPAVVRLDSVGADVLALQVILRKCANQAVAVDGTFGPATDAAARNLQAIAGLTVDGICGPKTWAVALQLANS